MNDSNEARAARATEHWLLVELSAIDSLLPRMLPVTPSTAATRQEWIEWRAAIVAELEKRRIAA